MPRQRESMRPWLDLDYVSIDHFRQNKPSYVVEDVLEYFSDRFGTAAKDRQAYDAVWSILLARGVLKWMSSRRALLAFKMLLRLRIRDHQQRIQEKKKNLSDGPYGVTRLGRKCSQVTPYHLGKLRGSLASTELIYKQIQKICHSMRWQVPDNDVRRTPYWIANRAQSGKDLLYFTDEIPTKRKTFPADWTEMKAGDEFEFSCSVCQKVGFHKLAGMKRVHKETKTFELPVWICPGDTEEIELACFKCGCVETYRSGDPRLCQCGRTPYSWGASFPPGFPKICSRCRDYRDVVYYGPELVCAKCSHHDPAGSWFRTWIQLFNDGER